MEPSAELSEFLRSRRARLKPQDVGLPEYGRHRRVPGLRREELAQLAGVSVAYYTRLEQGHGRNVSMEVLDAIARALRLSDTERAHLTHLAKPTVKKRQRAAIARPQRVRASLTQLLDSMDGVPAFVLGRRLDILAWNRMARALLGDFAAWEPAERNMPRMVFLDPNARDLYVDWEHKAVEVVSVLRLYAGCYPDDPQLLALVGELSVRSEEFRSLWAAHTVTDKGHGTKRLRHPLVGELTLSYESLKVAGDDPDLVLVTYHAEPGTASADALRLLAGWGVDETVDVRE
ncbi:MULTISPECIES: helix-turn-helix domain-containing protein [Streptomyces]|jgi:transcriptional regulator with XRE-family HTH domain|uniref:helix-turn-helix domain-containing protein n=1 Tax=Streptomyces TaxID=1883 RepID=UPI000938945E|nr:MULTISPECIES: helix-turn-helix transcriptional regulator [Streptomyces]MBX9423258.1 helix-turn-helix transcriptional regulator [Streptomyces lateritius]OKJ67915.1 XRE family transcriptional regulator [Streptomyces sp. CB02261]